MAFATCTMLRGCLLPLALAIVLALFVVLRVTEAAISASSEAENASLLQNRHLITQRHSASSANAVPNSPESRRCILAVGNVTTCPQCDLAARELRRYIRAATSLLAVIPIVHQVSLPTTVPEGCGAGVDEVFVVGLCGAFVSILTGVDVEIQLSILPPRAGGSNDSPRLPHLPSPHRDAHVLASSALADGTPVFAACGSTGIAALYSVYTYVERFGVRFYSHGDVLPPADPQVVLPRLSQRGEVFVPDFAVRGANTWGTWTEGFDWWTTDNWRGFITQLVKMRCNFIGMHSCVCRVPPYLSCKCCGIPNIAGYLRIFPELLAALKRNAPKLAGYPPKIPLNVRKLRQNSRDARRLHLNPTEFAGCTRIAPDIPRGLHETLT